MNAEFESELYRWEARTEDWFFIDLPSEFSADIRELPTPPRGFGAVRVEVLVGAMRWRTSVFPDKEREVYVLPIKRAVRVAHDLGEGDPVRVNVTVLGA